MSTGIIKINRGDSFEFTIQVPELDSINKSNILRADEAIYFALLCPHQRFEDAIIIKGYDATDQNAKNGSILVKITPKDTTKLTPGVYYYTVKLQRGGTLATVGDFDNAIDVKTLIERTKFIINE